MDCRFSVCFITYIIPQTPDSFKVSGVFGMFFFIEKGLPHFILSETAPLNPSMIQLEIEAPLVARKAKPGQFIILRVDEEGERIPLTVAGTDPERGTVKIIFQVVGATDGAPEA